MEIILKYFTEFSKKQLEQINALESLYKEWNAKINIISRKDIDGLYEKHVLHSLSIAAVFAFEPGAEIIDIGTGGGFPGIPLAIFFPEVSFHLVDSIAKKLKVVDAIAQEIGLENLTTRHIRAEEIKNKRFDFAVSRAVAPLKDLWRWSKPLLKTQGTRHKVPTLAVGIPTSFAASGHKAQEEFIHTSTSPPALICLKGGDLNAEIRESGKKPRVIDIADIFTENYFKEKYILFVSR